jgi:hypothetical protein
VTPHVSAFRARIIENSPFAFADDVSRGPHPAYLFDRDPSRVADDAELGDVGAASSGIGYPRRTVSDGGHHVDSRGSRRVGHLCGEGCSYDDENSCESEAHNAT